MRKTSSKPSRDAHQSVCGGLDLHRLDEVMDRDHNHRPDRTGGDTAADLMDHRPLQGEQATSPLSLIIINHIPIISNFHRDPLRGPNRPPPRPHDRWPHEDKAPKPRDQGFEPAGGRITIRERRVAVTCSPGGRSARGNGDLGGERPRYAGATPIEQCARSRRSRGLRGKQRTAGTFGLKDTRRDRRQQNPDGKRSRSMCSGRSVGRPERGWGPVRLSAEECGDTPTAANGSILLPFP